MNQLVVGNFVSALPMTSKGKKHSPPSILQGKSKTFTDWTPRRCKTYD